MIQYVGAFGHQRVMIADHRLPASAQRPERLRSLLHRARDGIGMTGASRAFLCLPPSESGGKPRAVQTLRGYEGGWVSRSVWTAFARRARQDCCSVFRLAAALGFASDPSQVLEDRIHLGFKSERLKKQRTLLCCAQRMSKLPSAHFRIASAARKWARASNRG